MATLSSILARKSHGERSLAGYHGGVAKSHEWLLWLNTSTIYPTSSFQVLPKICKKKMALSDFTLSAQCFFYIIKADQKLTKKAAFGNVRLTLAFWTHTDRKWRDARKKYCMQMIAKRIEMAILRLKTSAAAAAKSLQSCLTLCDPRDGSPPGSPVPGILKARTLEWVVISFSNAWKWKVKVKSLSHVWPSATPWTAAFQAPPYQPKFQLKSVKKGQN